MRESVAGLLLAAGGGARLGGRVKALLERGGRPLVELGVEALRAAGCPVVHVVLGAGAEEVRARARLAGAGARCVVVENPAWRSGMGSSLRAGLASVAASGVTRAAGGAGGALVALVDQPGVGAAAMARVLAAYRSPATLAAASYGGRRGHPVLIGADHFVPAGLAARGDQGARAFLREREEAGALRLVECGDVATADDIDTPEDLWKLSVPSGR
jgi:CTP:molybdopterin cytidylyltransferase MocA